MSESPKDVDSSIVSDICKGILKGVWKIFQIVLLVGIVIWVQSYPAEAKALVTMVADGISYLFHAAADALKPEAVPNTP